MGIKVKVRNSAYQKDIDARANKIDGAYAKMSPSSSDKKGPSFQEGMDDMVRVLEERKLGNTSEDDEIIESHREILRRFLRSNKRSKKG